MQTLFKIAAEQFGVFTRPQAHRCGVSDGALRRRVHAGAVEQLARHVYRIAGSPETWSQRVLVACFAGGDECVASHRTAAALHNFDGIRTGRIEVTVPRGTWYRRAKVVIHSSLDLAACDRSFVGPIPVTTPERTLIDLGAVTRFERVEEAFDGAERDAIAQRDAVSIRHAQVRRQGRRGVGPMAVVLDRRLGAPPRFVIERRFLRLLENARLPIPACQHPVELARGRTVWIDAAFVAIRLGFELDGHGSHATRRQRERDNKRAGELADVGWELRRFTYEQVMSDGRAVVAEVRRAFAARSCVT